MMAPLRRSGERQRKGRGEVERAALSCVVLDVFWKELTRF